jgi:hypothetical protein
MVAMEGTAAMAATMEERVAALPKGARMKDYHSHSPKSAGKRIKGKAFVSMSN